MQSNFKLMAKFEEKKRVKEWQQIHWKSSNGKRQHNNNNENNKISYWITPTDMQSLWLVSSYVRLHIEWLEYVQCGKKSARFPHHWNQYHNRIWWHIIGNHWFVLSSNLMSSHRKCIDYFMEFSNGWEKKGEEKILVSGEMCLKSLSISLGIEDSPLHSLCFRSFNMPMDMPYRNWNVDINSAIPVQTVRREFWNCWKLARLLCFVVSFFCCVPCGTECCRRNYYY